MHAKGMKEEVLASTLGDLSVKPYPSGKRDACKLQLHDGIRTFGEPVNSIADSN